MTLTKISSPTWTTCSGISTWRSASSEMWTRPSMPSSTRTNAPNGTSLVTLPGTTWPIWWVRANCCHGSSCVALSDRETRSRSMSTSSTSTVTSWPTSTTSDGWSMCFQDSSETCTRPSTPPRSTNAPKLTIEETTPVRTWPFWSLLRNVAAHLGLGLLEPGTAGQDHVVAVLVQLDDLGLELLAHVGLEVADAAHLDQRGGQEAAQADVEDEATLDDLDDGAGDDAVLFLDLLDRAPGALVLRALLGQDQPAFLVLLLEDQGLDLVADVDDLVRVDVVLDGQLARGDDALGLVADVEQDLVPVDLDDDAFDDVAVVEVLDGLVDRGEEVFRGADVVDRDLRGGARGRPRCWHVMWWVAPIGGAGAAGGRSRFAADRRRAAWRARRQGADVTSATCSVSRHTGRSAGAKPTRERCPRGKLRRHRCAVSDVDRIAAPTTQLGTVAAVTRRAVDAAESRPRRAGAGGTPTPTTTTPSTATSSATPTSSGARRGCARPRPAPARRYAGRPAGAGDRLRRGASARAGWPARAPRGRPRPLGRHAAPRGRAPSPRPGTAVPLVQADAARCRSGRGSFDLAFSAYGAVPFVADSAAVMREVARVLRPGGRFVFSVTHPIRWAFPDDPGPDGPDRDDVLLRPHAPYVEHDAAGQATYVEHHRTLGDRVREVVGAGLPVLDLSSRSGRTATTADVGPVVAAARPAAARHGDLRHRARRLSQDPSAEPVCRRSQSVGGAQSVG